MYNINVWNENKAKKKYKTFISAKITGNLPYFNVNLFYFCYNWSTKKGTDRHPWTRWNEFLSYCLMTPALNYYNFRITFR